VAKIASLSSTVSKVDVILRELGPPDRVLDTQRQKAFPFPVFCTLGSTCWLLQRSTFEAISASQMHELTASSIEADRDLLFGSLCPARVNIDRVLHVVHMRTFRAGSA